MRIRKVAGILIGIAVTFAMAAPAAAQDKTLANAGIGYLYFHGATTAVDSASGTKNFTKGLLLSAAGRINDMLSGVFELSTVLDPSLGSNVPGAQISGTTPAPCAAIPPETVPRSCALSQTDAHGSMKIWDLNTGLRVSSGSGKKWEAFGQFLVGWQRRSGQFINTDGTTAVPQGTRIPGTNPATNTGSATNDGLNLQPGGGVDFWLSKKVGVRFQGDFELIKADTTLPVQTFTNTVGSRWTNNGRFVVSLIFQGVKK